MAMYHCTYARLDCTRQRIDAAASAGIAGEDNNSPTPAIESFLLYLFVVYYDTDDAEPANIGELVQHNLNPMPY